MRQIILFSCCLWLIFGSASFSDKLRYAINEPYCGIVPFFRYEDQNVAKFESEEQQNDTRIIGGKITEWRHWPWVAAIVYEDKTVFCGATIMNRRFILTAGHCKVEEIMPKLSVYVWNVVANKPVKHEIKWFKTHPHYERDTLNHDNGLIKLKTRLENFVPICLATDTKIIDYGQLKVFAYVVGWGDTMPNTRTFESKLRKVKLPIVEQHLCRSDYIKINTTVTSEMICAGQGTRDACQGDSGGPLMFRFGDDFSHRFVQYGIVSFGEGCGRKKTPGVYARVHAKKVNWLLEEMNKV